MTYQVLARRWRPQTFEEVVGQAHVVRTLTNSIEANRIGHAYLFTGVRGVGKTSVARILAKALNCVKGPTPTPDNTCSICAEITAGSNLDVLEIDGASNTGVDDVRELRENIKYMPQGARYKIYIIDEVHMLSNAAFNALLKTLEEPPAHVIFIFATTEPQKIPLTILSRCQRLDFRRIAGGDLLKSIREICDKDGVSISDADLRLITREAGGSMRDALSLLDQVISFSGNEVPEGEVAKALGIVDREWLVRIIDALIERDPKKALEVVDKAHFHGYDLRELLRGVIAHLRHMAIVKVAKEPESLIDLMEEEIKVISAQAARLTPEEIQALFSVLSRVEDGMGRAQDPKLVIEMALLQAAQSIPAMSVDEAIQRLDMLERRLGGGSKPPGGSTSLGAGPSGSSNSEPTLFNSSPSSNAAQCKTFSWQALLDLAHEKKAHALCGILEHVEYAGFEDGRLSIHVAKDSFEEGRLKEMETQRQIEELAEKICGEKTRLKALARTSPDKKTPRHRESDKDRAVKREAMEHPRVKDVQEIFGAPIKEVRSLSAARASKENKS